MTKAYRSSEAAVTAETAEMPETAQPKEMHSASLRKGDSADSDRTYTFDFVSPHGRLGIVATERAVTEIRFGGFPSDANLPFHADNSTAAEADIRKTLRATPAHVMQAFRELTEYFAGTRRTFTFPIAPQGTPFQQSVWEALRTIPYGQTRTYGQIAAQIGRPKACRAVGMANHCNPIPIVIPCHRVVGSDGSPTGYAGGLELKMALLGLEARAKSASDSPDRNSTES